jgi:hypothetical protein
VLRAVKEEKIDVHESDSYDDDDDFAYERMDGEEAHRKEE